MYCTSDWYEVDSAAKNQNYLSEGFTNVNKRTSHMNLFSILIVCGALQKSFFCNQTKSKFTGWASWIVLPKTLSKFWMEILTTFTRFIQCDFQLKTFCCYCSIEKYAILDTPSNFKLNLSGIYLKIAPWFHFDIFVFLFIYFVALHSIQTRPKWSDSVFGSVKRLSLSKNICWTKRKM